MEVKEEPESSGIEHVFPKIQPLRQYFFQHEDKSFVLTSANQDDVEPELLLNFYKILKQSLPNMHANELYQAVFSISNENLLFFLKGKLIGGLTFNSEEDQFAHIVFLAISPEYRSKGNGQFLMNLFKRLLQQRLIMVIVTHADNSSKGFYFKQGFSETEFISNSHWTSSEQHYYFSTKMQCLVYPKQHGINYFHLKSRLTKQKQLLMNITKTHCLDLTSYQTTFPQRKQPYLRVEEEKKEYFFVDPMSLEGVSKNGWSWAEYKRQGQVKSTWAYRVHAEFFPLLYHMAQPQLKELKESPHFPLNKPRDLTQLAEKVMSGVYESTVDFWSDFDLFVRQSRKFYNRNQRIILNLELLRKEAAKMRNKMG